jgi:hypothetical protein
MRGDKGETTAVMKEVLDLEFDARFLPVHGYAFHGRFIFR